MEKKIEWSKNAENNLKNIFDYIANDSEIYATRFITKLVQHTESELVNYPHIGKKVVEFENTYLERLREIIFKGYRVIYEPETTENQITIIAVLNGRRSIRKHMQMD